MTETAYKLSKKRLTNTVKKLEVWAYLTAGNETQLPKLKHIFPWAAQLLAYTSPKITAKQFVASLNQLIQHYLEQNQGLISRLFRSTSKKAFAAPLLKSISNPDLLSRIVGFLAPTTHPLNKTYVLRQLFDINALPEDRCTALHHALLSIQEEYENPHDGKRACLDGLSAGFDQHFLALEGTLAFAAENKQAPTA